MANFEFRNWENKLRSPVFFGGLWKFWKFSYTEFRNGTFSELGEIDKISLLELVRAQSVPKTYILYPGGDSGCDFSQ